MAKRLNPKHDEATRQKIQTSQLINRLMQNALGELGEKEMTNSQVRSAEILLKKTLPDLSSVENSVDPDSIDAMTKFLELIKNTSRGIPASS